MNNRQIPEISFYHASYIIDDLDLNDAYQLMQTNSFWCNAVYLSNIWHKTLLKKTDLIVPIKNAKAVLYEINRLKKENFDKISG